MSSFRFLHAADIHLDSPLRGLSNYPGAPLELLRSATRDAFSNMVEFAIRERVAFVVIAGDLYDGDWRDFNTGIYFSSAMGRLAQADIPVVLLRGNHDAESQITKTLRLPGNVHLFGARRPETIRFEHLGVALHGQSFAHREVTDNLAAAYPEPAPGVLNIGVLHTALEGSAEHASYAPCTLQELVTRGYDYWALGHVHERKVVHEDPYIVFSGNLQGRNIREIGAKGAVLVSCEEGAVIGVDMVDFDVARWQFVEVGASGTDDLTGVLDRVRAEMENIIRELDLTLAVRLRIGGRTAAHGQLLRDEERVEAEIRALSSEIGADRLWVERIFVATEPESGEPEWKHAPDGVATLRRMMEEAPGDEDLAATLRAEFADLLARLPAELRPEVSDTELSALRDGDIETLIRKTAPALMARLLAGESAE